MDRRDFLITGGLAAAGLAVGCTPGMQPALPPPQPVLGAGAGAEDLVLAAIDAARRAGASYADARVVLVRNQSVGTRERQVTGIVDQESQGIGVRALVNGAWGFTATRELTLPGAQGAATAAVAQARQNATGRRAPVVLAPAEPGRGSWRSPLAEDPFGVAIEDKVELLLRANEEALRGGARFVTSSLAFVLERKTYANTDGALTRQDVYRCWPQMTVTAVAGADFQTRQSTPVAPMGLGYEYVRAADLPGRAPQWAEDALRKLEAKPVEPGTYDLVLLPSHLFLTIHESIAHPTELDRILGYEANYAGTSFIQPLEDYLGRFRYGPAFMQIQGERSAPGGLATVGWDDEGVRPRDYLIVRNGTLHDLQTTREQAPYLADWYARIGEPVRSHGNSHAQSWADVQFQRMPNINLLPDAERDVSIDELIADVRRGIVIEGRGSYSIDQQRYNAQFGGQIFHEIRDGRVVGMLKDVAYEMRTPDFWNSLDLLGGPSTYEVHGTFNDGKGQPAQSNAVSHGCPAARFRGASVINTGRQA
jgi:TldD protein